MGGESDNAKLRPEARLGGALRWAREQQGIGLRALARKLYRSHSTLVEYERGHRLAPLDVVQAYEAELGLAPGTLADLHEQARLEVYGEDRSHRQTYVLKVPSDPVPLRLTAVPDALLRTAHPDALLRTAHLAALLASADARATSDMEGAKLRFRQAIHLARELAAPEEFGRAVLGLAGVQKEAWGDEEPMLVTLLEEALRLLGQAEPPLRARLLATLARELYLLPVPPERPGASERSASLMHKAEHLAKQSHDASSLAYVLHALHYTMWEQKLPSRLEVSSEIIRLAKEGEDDEMALMGHHWRIIDLLEQGDLDGVERELYIYQDLAEKTSSGVSQWYLLVLRATRELVRGRFTEAERFANEALAVGQNIGRAEAPGFYAVQKFLVLRGKGQLEELETLLRLATDQYGWNSLSRIALVNVTAHLKEKERAQRQFERLAEGGFAAVPHGPHRVPLLALLAETCAVLGDQRHAQGLYELLLPYAGRNVASAGFGCLGPVDHYLGLLAQILLKDQSARRHFEAAMDLSARMGAYPSMASTSGEYARMLIAGGEPKDRVRGLGLLRQALAISEELEMAHLTRVVSTHLHDMTAADEMLTPGHATPTAAEWIFRRQGQFWEIGREEQRVLLRDAKGLRDIAYLLHNPGREYLATDLVALQEGGCDPESHGRVVDPLEFQTRDLSRLHITDQSDWKMISTCRRHLEELEEERDEACSVNDYEKLATIEEQVHKARKILNELVRSPASPGERARVAVTKRIGRALEEIRRHDQLTLVWAHLATSIQKGRYCSYRPDPAAHIHWKF